MSITTSTTLACGSKFLVGPFQAPYSFNNSNKSYNVLCMCQFQTMAYQ